jgi:hypothetical protein
VNYHPCEHSPETCDSCALKQAEARLAALEERKSSPVPPPKTEDEWRAWDAYASAALTGSLWWNRHKPISAEMPAEDAALIADRMLELRRKRRLR